MSTFTMQLKEVIDVLYNPSIEDEFVQEYAALTFGESTYGKLPVLPQYNYIGLAYYPIFDEGYRKILNGKIIDEYYVQEIGTESVDNFVLILRKKMDQVMPYYNQLYKSQQLEFNPLLTMDIHSVGTNVIDGTETVQATNKSDSDTKSESRATNLNFPQTALADNADYATSAVDSNATSEVDATSNQESESASNTQSNSDNHVTGYQGISSNLIVAYRNSLINIDTMVIDEIKDCFMLLNNNGDSYTPNSYYSGWSY